MSGYTFRGYYIPERMMGGLTRYVESGIPPASFLSAVIRNDLADAVGYADDENMANLPAYVGWLTNEAPANCWGSEELMEAWINNIAERSA